MSLWYRFLNWWNPLKALAAIIGGALVLDSVSAVWGERRPIGSFFEEFVARSGHYIVVVGSFIGAIYVGAKCFEKSKSKIVGWAAGIAVFIIAAVGGTLTLSSIPGVGWRYERLQNSMENDY